MEHPTFDADGYPTEETLEAIRTWPHEDMPGLFEFIGEAWHWPDYWQQKGRTIRAHTGGWSGNESLIAALTQNFMIWGLCWHKSERGGHCLFKIPEYQMKASSGRREEVE